MTPSAKRKAPAIPQTVIVTGAAGFIGSHLVDRLLARGDTVIGIDNFDPFYDKALKQANLEEASRDERFSLLTADCQNLTTLEERLSSTRVDAIAHLAAKAGVRPSIEDPVGYASANVTGTQAMLELSRRLGVRRFVFASSSSVYGNNARVPFSETDAADEPISPYAATKRAGELACRTYHHLYDLSVIALRFFTVYGPRQRPDLAIRKFATLMLAGEPIPVFGDGSTARDYTWIDDIIDGVVAAVDRTAEVPPEFEIVNLGGSRTTTLSELIALLGTSLGVTPEIRRKGLQPGDVDRTYANVTRARDLLGYEPSTPIHEGIPRFAAWMKEVASRSTPAG